MSTRRWILFGGATLLCATAAAAASVEKRVELPIARVTVYEDRALVVRAGDVDLPKGSARFVLDGLPATIEEASVRASLEEAAGAKVVSVMSRKEERAEASSEKMREAEDAVEKLERKLARLQSDDAALEREARTVGAVQDMARLAASEHATAGQADPLLLGRITEFFAQRLERIGSDRRGVAQSIAKLHEELNDARANLEKVSSRRSKTVNTIIADIESPAAARVSMSVSYIARDCGWTPRYDARLTGGLLRVTYQGEVRQKTGEDWNHVTLALSTARPALGARRPELLPVRMWTVETGPVSKTVTTRFDREAPVAVGGENAPMTEAAPVETGDVTAVVSPTGTSVAFVVPEKADIPADGRAHKVSVTAFEDPSPKLSYETVPKMLRYVFLKCDTANNSSFPMLAGPVDVWRESGFVGTSSSEFVAPKGTFSLSFGIDENLKVKRVLDEQRTKESMLGSRREHRSAFDIEVANYRQDPTMVAVKESVPVSDVEEVEVSLDPSTTPTTEQDKEKGILTWKLTLAPGEKKKVHVEYVVKLPKDYSWSE